MAMSVLMRVFDILGNYIAAALSLSAIVMGMFTAELFFGGRIDEVQCLALLAIFLGAERISQGLVNHRRGFGRRNFVGWRHK
ncbi:MAG: hypothetical protein OXD35_05140 [Thiotrichales bacterium]|nr:hypothetical protein [Thiotrichales bacterium]